MDERSPEQARIDRIAARALQWTADYERTMAPGSPVRLHDLRHSLAKRALREIAESIRLHFDVYISAGGTARDIDETLRVYAHASGVTLPLPAILPGEGK